MLFLLCRKIAYALLEVMNSLVVHGYCHWIFAVPLYHFLTNTAKPFGRTSAQGFASHRKPQWWGIAGFEKLVDGFKKYRRDSM